MDKSENNSASLLQKSIITFRVTMLTGSLTGKLRTKIIIVLLLLLIIPDQISAQKKQKQIAPPVSDDFYESLLVLSSPQMEGREAGKRGSMMASDYIASKMKFNGLQPFGDLTSEQSRKKQERRSWFQNFKALTFRDYRDSMLLTGVTTTTRADTASLRNVLGIINGKDRSKNIIIGAHYDHLGIRDGKTFFGADDNASGVAGMLALAAKWSASGIKPPCNLIFAAWAAEEKGLIGSSYFVQQKDPGLNKILLVINMDMIAGNAPEDTLHRTVSIGTLPESANLRRIAIKANRSRSEPFELDLWDVVGHWGSDYACFSTTGIPVMTFFSGFSDYYHTPDDTMDRTDLPKMENILKLVNDCLFQVADSLRTR
jgi:hypothetical protein